MLSINFNFFERVKGVETVDQFSKYGVLKCNLYISHEFLLTAYVCVENGQSKSSAQYRVVSGSSFWFVGVTPFSNDAQRNQYEG